MRQNIVVRPEVTAMAVGAKLELPSDHLAIEEPQLHERRGKHALDFGPDSCFEGTDLRETLTISRLDIGDVGLSLLTVNRRGHKLRASSVDMGEQLLHHCITEEPLHDKMRAAVKRHPELVLWRHEELVPVDLNGGERRA